jgi:hypothetical protein
VLWDKFDGNANTSSSDTGGDTSRLIPSECLDAGRKILRPVFLTHLFVYVDSSMGSSSGGAFAVGAYVRWRRRFEFHFRRSLGLVTYRIGTVSLSHDDYMWALLGSHGGNRYPNFSDDPLQQFRDLRYDLENYCKDFLGGSGREFLDCARRASRRPRGFAALNT